MKQLTFLFSLLFSLALSATEVDLQKATNIAKSFGESNNLQIPLSHQTTHVIESNTQTLAWVFSSENNGFIAVAADLRVSPVVAYNDSGSFETGSPLYLLLKADLAHRLKHIGSQRQPAAQRVKRDWEVLLTGTREDYDQWPEPGSTSTGGWIETFWHQQHPFNKFAPINLDTGERSLTGCPATAIAQILNYHQTTNNTRFSQDDRYYHNYMQQFWIDDDWETYDFISFDSLNIYLDRIDDAFYSDAGLTEDMKAALSLAAGFASKTVYTPQISGTFGVIQAYEAYQRFGFQEAVLLDDDYSDQEIREKMIENIKNGLPVHLAVVDPNWQSGHNAICDGYRDNGFFRINMGWGGQHDSWYNLPEGFPYNLTVFEGIIADIHGAPTPSYQVDFLLVNHEDTPIPGAEIVIETIDTILETNHEGYATIDLGNGQYLFSVFLNNTEVYSGSFTIDNEDKSILVEIISTNTTYEIDKQNIRVFPNPTSCHLNIHASKPIHSISIVNQDGKIVQTIESRINNPEKLQLPFQDYKPGYYLIRIRMTNGSYFTKWVLKIE